MVTHVRLSTGHQTRLFRRWLWSLRCTSGQFRRRNRSAKSNIDFMVKTNIPALCSQLELGFCHAGKVERRSINSCLCPVGSLDGCVVTTSEGIGSSKKGFSQIQGPPLALSCLLATQVAELDVHTCLGCIYCQPVQTLACRSLCRI